ncbi:MAG: hypothetical protein R3B06_02140 [Kofleriaceae bacterium]
MSARATAVAAALAAACVVPPSQSSLGVGATGAGLARRISVGAHSVALDARGEMPVDLGAGWVVETDGAGASAHGTYLALARQVAGPGWLGGRAELYWDTVDGQPTRALVVRAGLRQRVVGGRAGASDGGGAFGVLGVLAVGGYLDLGARQLDGGGGEAFAAVGVTVDLPAVAGLARH